MAHHFISRVQLIDDMARLGTCLTDLQQTRVQQQANRISHKIEAWIDVQKVYNGQGLPYYMLGMTIIALQVLKSMPPKSPYTFLLIHWHSTLYMSTLKTLSSTMSIGCILPRHTTLWQHYMITSC